LSRVPLRILTPDEYLKRAVVIVTTDEYPGGFALVLTGALLMAMADAIRDADRRNGAVNGT